MYLRQSFTTVASRGGGRKTEEPHGLTGQWVQSLWRPFVQILVYIRFETLEKNWVSSPSSPWIGLSPIVIGSIPPPSNGIDSTQFMQCARILALPWQNWFQKWCKLLPWPNLVKSLHELSGASGPAWALLRIASLIDTWHCCCSSSLVQIQRTIFIVWKSIRMHNASGKKNDRQREGHVSVLFFLNLLFQS